MGKKEGFFDTSQHNFSIKDSLHISNICPNTSHSQNKALLLWRILFAIFTTVFHK